MSIGDRIKHLRKQNGVTQFELSKQLGVSTGAVGLWELNKREPDLTTLLKLAQIFKVSVDYLLDDSIGDTVTIIGRNGYYQKFTLTEDKIKVIAQLAEVIDNKQNK